MTTRIEAIAVLVQPIAYRRGSEFARPDAKYIPSTREETPIARLTLLHSGETVDTGSKQASITRAR